MYIIKNGYLNCNGKKVFALGESYYPSFHKAKYPVPPEGDRIGEMKKDLRMMREMGFNHVRFAAIGLTELDKDGNLVISTPFVDAMIDEAAKNNLSVSIRLQGFSFNLRNFKNVLMLNNKGEEQDTTIWYDFIQFTMHHKGMLEDNALATSGLAQHFDKFENLVAYQIYNEPHYPDPNNGYYDYHPLAIEAYRKWIVAKGYMTAKDAENYEPPRGRKEQSAHMWALWRVFSQDTLSNFLKVSSDAAKSVSNKTTFTCLTTSQVGALSPIRGVDNLADGKDFDIVGFTCYINAEGANYFNMCQAMDIAYSGAALQGKKSWCSELDSRTKIPLRIFNKNTYATVGTGVTGILYYQWRGDHPSEATPIPNGCGLVNYDGSKTPNFENAGNMVKLLNDLSDYIVNAEKANYGIGILFSDYSNFYYDAAENDDIHYSETVNTFLSEFAQMYKELRCAGYSVSIVNSESLEKNTLNVKTLFVPGAKHLSDEEIKSVKKFTENGGTAYELKREPSGCPKGYIEYGNEIELYKQFMTIEDIADNYLDTLIAASNHHNAMLQILEGADYKIITIVNTSCPHKKISFEITCSYNINSAKLYTNIDKPQKLEVVDNKIICKDISDGGFIITK